MKTDIYEQFRIFSGELVEWNKKFNLTSITDEKDIKTKHFDDSLTLSQAYDFLKGSPMVVDIGAGAGLPGIPMKIAYPNIRLTLVEATKKKAEFIRHILEILELKDAEVIWGRAEDLVEAHCNAPVPDHPGNFRETFDVAVCRAFAPLNIAAEVCLPFVRTGGELLAMKSSNIEKELASAKNAIDKAGGMLKDIVSVVIPETQINRKIVVVSKVSATPANYPRKMGIARKRPL